MKRDEKRQHLAGDEATYCTKPLGTTLAWACQGKQAALTLVLLEQIQMEFCNFYTARGCTPEQRVGDLEGHPCHNSPMLERQESLRGA